MRYVKARYEEYNREEAYRICVTDSLRLISENSATFTRGKYYNLRYFDIVHPKKQEERTAQEVIDHIKQGLANMGGG